MSGGYQAFIKAITFAGLGYISYEIYGYPGSYCLYLIVL